MDEQNVSPVNENDFSKIELAVFGDSPCENNCDNLKDTEPPKTTMDLQSKHEDHSLFKQSEPLGQVTLNLPTEESCAKSQYLQSNTQSYPGFKYGQMPFSILTKQQPAYHSHPPQQPQHAYHPQLPRQPHHPQQHQPQPAHQYQPVQKHHSTKQHQRTERNRHPLIPLPSAHHLKKDNKLANKMKKTKKYNVSKRFGNYSARTNEINVLLTDSGHINWTNWMRFISPQLMQRFSSVRITVEY